MDRPLHIAIIDDDQDDIDFLTDIFCAHHPNTRFTIFSDGPEALKSLLEQKSITVCPDLLFLDMHLPRLSGYEILRKIRASDSICQSVSTMILSTFLQPEEIERCRAAGCDACFSKPSSLEGYHSLVDEALNLLRSRDPQYSYP
jgi:CheY-like chemotaxis protein